MLTRNAKIRLVLFTLYVLLYGGFVFTTALSPRSMSAEPVDGLNLAIVYGFVLIIAAFVLAILYGVLCGPETDAAADSEEGAES